MESIKVWSPKVVLLALAGLWSLPSTRCMAGWEYVGGGDYTGTPESDYDWPDQHWAWGWDGNANVTYGAGGVTTNGSVEGGCWVDFDVWYDHDHDCYVWSCAGGYAHYHFYGAPLIPLHYDWSIDVSGTVHCSGSAYDYDLPDYCTANVDSGAGADGCTNPGGSGSGGVNGSVTATTWGNKSHSTGTTVTYEWADVGSYGITATFTASMADDGSSDDATEFTAEAVIEGVCDSSGNVTITQSGGVGEVHAESSYECSGSTQVDVTY